MLPQAEGSTSSYLQTLVMKRACVVWTLSTHSGGGGWLHKWVRLKTAGKSWRKSYLSAFRGLVRCFRYLPCFVMTASDYLDTFIIHSRRGPLVRCCNHMASRNTGAISSEQLLRFPCHDWYTEQGSRLGNLRQSVPSKLRGSTLYARSAASYHGSILLILGAPGMSSWLANMPVTYFGSYVSFPDCVSSDTYKCIHERENLCVNTVSHIQLVWSPVCSNKLLTSDLYLNFSFLVLRSSRSQWDSFPVPSSLKFAPYCSRC